MVPNEPDERLVYLACRHLFRDLNSHLRKPKPIKSVLEKNTPALTDILREYDIEGLSSVVKKLLEAQVFESTLKAKIRFPELFDVSPAQSAERETSEAEAARDEANSIKEISEKEFTPSNAVDLLPETSRADKGKEKLDEYLAEHDRQPDREIPSLYPIYIPYRSQHLITSSVQSIVEESCFIFGQQHFPQLLARKQWDCPEAVELTEWTKILAQNHTLLNTTVVKAAKKPLDEIFGLLRELRHSVVHRLRRSASGVERLVENAELFVEVLQDQDRLGKISILRNELKTAIEELARNKDLLEASLLAQLKDIRAERAKLDLREQNAIQAMTDDDLQYLDDTGHRLVDMVMRMQSSGVKSVNGEPIMARSESGSDSEAGSESIQTICC